MPPSSSNEVVDGFLACLVSLISMHKRPTDAIEPLEYLFEYTKNDQNLFERFKPNKLIVRKMRIDNIIINGEYNEQQKALDFAAFVLRYN